MNVVVFRCLLEVDTQRRIRFQGQDDDSADESRLIACSDGVAPIFPGKFRISECDSCHIYITLALETLGVLGPVADDQSNVLCLPLAFIQYE